MTLHFSASLKVTAGAGYDSFAETRAHASSSVITTIIEHVFTFSLTHINVSRSSAPNQIPRIPLPEDLTPTFERLVSFCPFDIPMGVWDTSSVTTTNPPHPYSIPLHLSIPPFLLWADMEADRCSQDFIKGMLMEHSFAA